MTTTTTEPRIYVACLAAYNSGTLHGEWIDANQDADDIREEIAEMLKNSPIPDAEEWAIHDYEGFSKLTISEYEDIDDVAEYAQAIAEHGEAIAIYLDYQGSGTKLDVDAFQEAYRGCFRNEQEFGEQLFDELYSHEVPKFLEYYIDYEAFTRDLFCGDYWSADGSEGCHVFESL